MKFVFDIDGTICFDYTDLSKEATVLLDLLESKGHEVIFASARPVRDMIFVLKEKYRHHRLIGANGAMVSVDNEIVEMCHFESSQSLKILELLKQQNAIYLADGSWDYHYNGDGSHELMKYVNAKGLADNVSINQLGQIMKFVIFEADDMSSLLKDLEDMELNYRQHPSTLSIDLVACETNKYEALKQQGIEDYIAMGNDVNDKELLQHARLSVMIDHHDELVDIVDYKIAYDEQYLEQLKTIFAKYLE